MREYCREVDAVGLRGVDVMVMTHVIMVLCWDATCHHGAVLGCHMSSWCCVGMAHVVMVMCCDEVYFLSILTCQFWPNLAETVLLLVTDVPYVYISGKNGQCTKNGRLGIECCTRSGYVNEI